MLLTGSVLAICLFQSDRWLKPLCLLQTNFCDPTSVDARIDDVLIGSYRMHHNVVYRIGYDANGTHHDVEMKEFNKEEFEHHGGRLLQSGDHLKVVYAARHPQWVSAGTQNGHPGDLLPGYPIFTLFWAALFVVCCLAYRRAAALDSATARQNNKAY